MPRLQVYRFPDNIGHLARGGKDGWGRAFCKGLEMAIDGQYDYVVHIEGDSLFKRPVLPIIRQMMATASRRHRSRSRAPSARKPDGRKPA
jgi:hypothetical protein